MYELILRCAGCLRAAGRSGSVGQSWLRRGVHQGIALLLATILLCNFNTARCAGQLTSTLAGTGIRGFSGDGGPAELAQFSNPFAVARGPDGWLYVCDVDNQRIRRISPDGIATTFAGNGIKGYSGDGGPATDAALHEPYEMAWDRSGNLYVVERMNHTVRRIDSKTQTITTFAGTGHAGFGGDGGPATKAQLNQPHSLAFDADGTLLICDILNHRIRAVDAATGTIQTWSGNGEKRTAPDGSPIGNAPLHGPRALALATDGMLWLALREGNALLQLDPARNTLHRVAGNGRSGFSGNGGLALTATLSGPKCVAIDKLGNVWLADTESHSLRKVDRASGKIYVMVGDGVQGDGPDGPALECRLARPHGVYVDIGGSVLIADSENHRIRLLNLP